MWLSQTSNLVSLPLGVLVAAVIVILGAVTAQVISGIRARKSHEEIDEIFQLLKSLDPILRQASISTIRLDEVHLGPNAMDEDGAPKWYVRKSLEVAMAKLDETIEKFGDKLSQTFTNLDRTLDGMYHELKSMREDVRTLQDK